MKERMSRWGVGPTFASLSLIYGMTMLAINHYYYPAFRILFVSNGLLSITGIALIVMGVPFFIISVITVSKAYQADTLVTQGIFRCCRHPLYSSWVVFIVPGIFLLADSWIGLTTPFFMYFLLKKLVTREEIYLEQRFGSDYLEYKKRVPPILPFGFLKQSSNQAE